LTTMNMDIHMWDDVRQVAHAAVKEFMRGSRSIPCF